MNVDRSNSLFTVIVNVKGDQKDIKSVVDHAKSGLLIFKTFSGFVAGATHVSEDGTQVIQYLQWQDQSSYEACMTDDRWKKMESSKYFIKLIDEKRISVTVKGYKIVEVVQ